MPVRSRVFPVFFSGSFKVSALTLRSLIHFKFILVTGERSFTCGCPVFPTPFVEETAFSPTHAFGAFVENQMAVAMWTYFWIFYFIPSIYMSVFVLVP
jgi:hypothetical protein